MAVTEATRRWRVEGPVEGTPTLVLGNFDLAQHGYVAEEFVLDGTAHSYSEGPGGVQPAAVTVLGPCTADSSLSVRLMFAPAAGPSWSSGLT